jgi:hypothetical protein
MSLVLTITVVCLFIYVFIWRRFLSNFDYIASNEMMIGDDELERMWKKTVMS